MDALAGYRKLSFADHHAQNARLLAEVAVGETFNRLHPHLLSRCFNGDGEDLTAKLQSRGRLGGRAGHAA